MEKFKVYSEEGLFDEEEQFVKVKVDFTLKIPIEDINDGYITKEQMLENLFEIDRIDLGEDILNNAENFKPINE